MTDTSTLDVGAEGRQKEGSDAGTPGAFALILAWSAAQPDRIGEALLLPEQDTDSSFVFGRGEPRDDDGGKRLLLKRQLPGRVESRGPLEDPFVSRRQLVVSWHRDGVAVENGGKLALRIDGQPVRRAVVKPGETLEVDGRLLFVGARRPACLAELRNLKNAAGHTFGEPDGGGLVGENPSIWELRDRIAFIGPRTGHVLLLGESGTGKELVAQAIHVASARSGRKLVARNAATLPAGLIDAELFGNAANYPNQGMPERPGLVGESDGSTLFLDEIGELPESLQTHLLRVLDERHEYQRLGESRRRNADLRLVAATNRPIEQLKSDLAARLQLRVRLPSLNDRIDDVPLLVRSLLRRTAARDRDIADRFFEKGSARVSLGLMNELVLHRYTTNVRELDAVLWTALASSPRDTLEVTDEVRLELGAPARPSGGPPAATPPGDVTPERIRAALAKHNGVKDRVWPELGLTSRFALRRLMKKHGIADDDT